MAMLANDAFIEVMEGPEVDEVSVVVTVRVVSSLSFPPDSVAPRPVRTRDCERDNRAERAMSVISYGGCMHA